MLSSESYLFQKIEQASPDQQAYIALQLAEQERKSLARLRFWRRVEDGSAIAATLGTLLLLLNPGINHHVTQWYQAIEWLKVPVPEGVELPAVDLKPAANTNSQSVQSLVEQAKQWIGKEFNPGAQAQCAVFVREVLKSAGVDVGVTSKPIDNWTPNEATANSFFGEDLGTIKKSKEELQPGDLVAFGGTYGGYSPSTITHVGIYVGGGMMIDRSTSSEPVNHRSIDTFEHFVAGITLNAAKTQALPVEAIANSGNPQQSVLKVNAGGEMGSCFVAVQSLCVTNAHVMQRSSDAVLSDSSGKQYQASVVAKGEKAIADVAILKIQNGESLPVLPIGQPKPGAIELIGYAFGREQSTVSGEITEVTGDIKYVGDNQPGKSGGALIQNGAVVGLNKAKGQSDSLAVPPSKFQEFLNQVAR